VPASPLLRRAGGLLLALLVSAAGLVGMIAFFGGRDTSTFHQVEGPGQAFPDQGAKRLAAGAPRPRYNSDPPTSGPHVPAAIPRDGVRLSADQILTALATGNVVLVYSRSSFASPLRRLADRASGPYDPALAAAGQAVILDRDPGRHESGVVALAWRHLLRVPSPTDPALGGFLDFWLGRGAGGRGAG
jgi:hypothetical protein